MPKRSDQTIRRNKPDIPIEKIEIIGAVEIPELGITKPHPLVVDYYEAMKQAAQKMYFEPTDWQHARLAMLLLHKELRKARPSAQMMLTINQMLSNLLVSEGDRRRLRIEVERQSTATDNVVDVEALFREKMRQNA